MRGLLGIDAGGTHTDAVLLREEYAGRWHLAAAAKVRTNHADLPATIRQALDALRSEAQATGCEKDLDTAASVSIGATLAVNALVQGRADTVGLALAAGPGLRPERFALGEHVCIVPGGLDHRGTEVSPLDLTPLTHAAAQWAQQGVDAIACVSKFSPREPAHEKRMAVAAHTASGLPVSMGHSFSGQLNFPRRIATAYFNAAVANLQNTFLDAVEAALAGAGISAAPRLLKADGGAMPLVVARQSPVQSILSGPAASVMGVMALCPTSAEDCALLLDMGGTTTDMALLLYGSPVMERDGMSLLGRRTLVRALACHSIGVGGDSCLRPVRQGDSLLVAVGPERYGPAAAFGGQRPTLLDALNVLDAARTVTGLEGRGNVSASQDSMAGLAARHGLDPEILARLAVDNAMRQIREGADSLLQRINARPIYTLAALRAAHAVRPTRVWLVGGPAHCLRERLEQAMGLPVNCPPHTAVANAVGAALTLPSHSLELYADTGRRFLRVPTLELEEPVDKAFNLAAAKSRATEVLSAHLAELGVEGIELEVTESDIFATLDDGGYGSRDIRVVCQTKPGLVGSVDLPEQE